MAPKGKSSDAGNSDMPMRSHEGLIVSKEVKVLDCPKGTKRYIVIVNAKIYSKNKTSIYEIVKKEKNFVCFAVPFKLQNVLPQCLMRVS